MHPPLIRRRPRLRGGRPYAAVASVLAGALLVAGISGCGESSPRSGAPATGSSTPRVSPSAPAGTPGTSGQSPGGSPAAAPAEGPLVRGSGYRFHAPEGWRDVTGSVRSGSVGAASVKGLDRAAGARLPVHGFASNVNVVISPRGFAGADLASVTRQVRDSLRPTTPHYRVLGRTTLDGEPAGHLAGLRSEVDHPYWLEQYVATHDGRGYIVSFSFSPRLAEGKRERLRDGVLASWHWLR